ncbi:hypothetical protein LTR64_004547 [Lithohypha guttulata]|uniref:uncharacterized protein n=1 Tax=Lithohypha guttulata TaxID=1690604 RepID=UPI002DE0FAF1|nr:hypothetical protein LTR51_006155 [Lithohypha guttulata]
MTETTTTPWPREGYRAEWLALEDASGGRYFMKGDLAADRAVYDAVFAGISTQWPQYTENLDVWNEKMSVPYTDNDVRIYKPKSIDTNSPLPLMIFFHGGGYMAGTLDTEDAQCRFFATKTPCLVVSVNYEKVPKVKLDDIIATGVAAVPWCKAKARELGADPAKTVLNGGSAGAFLSAQVAYHYMSQGDYESISGLILLFAVAFPYTYGENGKYKDKFTAWAENGNAQVPIISRPLAEYIWSHYHADFNSPRHFPGLARDLSKFPPSYIVAAEKDCFRDDGILLNQLLQESGVPTKLDYYEGLPHYFHVFPALNAAHEMMDKAIEGVRFVLK